MTSVRAARRGGWFAVEAAVALTLVVMLMLAVTAVQNSAAQANHQQMVARRCVAAAQAALDSIAATGRALSEDDLKRLWPKIRVRVSRSPGRGEWAGLTLLAAVAAGESHGRQVEVDLRRYILPPAAGGEGP